MIKDSEFLSFLYSEKDRFHSNFSRPGWSNWVIGGAFVGLIIYLFNLLTELSGKINWGEVLILFISLLSLTFICIMLYFLIFPKEEIYYHNKITTLWNEAPIFDLAISGFSFLTIFILLLINHNYSWLIYMMGFLSLDKLLLLGIFLHKKNDLVAAGTKYNIIPNNGFIGALSKSISFVIFTGIMIFSSWDIMNNIGQYINEIKIAAVLISFWILIYIFFKTNLSPTKMINSLDNIIDKVVYGNMSQQEAMEELTIMRCGSDVNHIVKNDLSTYLNSLSRLNDINSELDKIIQNINEGKLKPKTWFEWSKYIQSQFSILRYTNSIGINLIRKCKGINNLPNNAKNSSAFGELLEFIEHGTEKIRLTTEKIQKIRHSLNDYWDCFHCRKSGGLCLNMLCEKRDEKMSFNYARKRYGVKYTLNFL